MATAVDKDAIKEAYTEVMADNNGIEWYNNQTSLTVINTTYCQGNFYLQGQHTWSHCKRLPIQ